MNLSCALIDKEFYTIYINFLINVKGVVGLQICRIDASLPQPKLRFFFLWVFVV